jgi:hypothetical protein
MPPKNGLVLFIAAVVLLTTTTEGVGGTGSSLANWFILPAVTHSPGKKGTFWKTDVAIVNPHPSKDLKVYVWFRPKDQVNSDSGGHVIINVPRGEQVILPDVVVNTFGVASGTGSMVLKTFDGTCFSISSRTYTGSTRTYGMMEAGQKHVTIGALCSFISGIKNDSRFRTNVGVASATLKHISVLVGAFDNHGHLKGETIISIKPWSTMQIAVDTFAEEFSDGYLVLSGLNSADDVKWVGYATTIDNVSGDSTFSAARTDAQYTWVNPLFDQTGWWEGSVSSAHGSFNGYLLVDQEFGRFEASIYDNIGMLRSRISGYENLGRIFVREMTVYEAMCMETEFVQSKITSEYGAIYGNLTVSSANPTECIDGTMTMYFSPLDDSPFTTSSAKAVRASVSHSLSAEPPVTSAP